MNLIIGLALGLYTIAVTTVYFNFRADTVPTTTKGSLIELFKWLVWMLTAIFVPLIAIHEFLNTDDQIIRDIWVGISFLSFSLYMFALWLKGDLVLVNRDGEIIYKGRKNNDN